MSGENIISYFLFSHIQKFKNQKLSVTNTRVEGSTSKSENANVANKHKKIKGQIGDNRLVISSANRNFI